MIQSILPLYAVDPLANKIFSVCKRDGRIEAFNEERIRLAIESAFKAEYDIKPTVSLSIEQQALVDRVQRAVVERLLARAVRGEELEVELIQDAVEVALMNQGHHIVARRYIIYRENRRKARLLHQEGEVPQECYVTLRDGTRKTLDSQRIHRTIIRACRGFEDRCKTREMAEEVMRNLYDGVRIDEVEKAMIFSAKTRLEIDPAYGYVTARLLLESIYREVIPGFKHYHNLGEAHRQHFEAYLKKGVAAGLLTHQLLEFDLRSLAMALRTERDLQFNYMGLQTIYDRYLLHSRQTRIETPQYFWMRVAMGLAMNEGSSKNERAIEFYNLLSSFLFISSTPTLFNSGTLHPQLSSCYLTTVQDDLDHIFKCISDDARLSKWAGGLGNDWTNVRASGSLIKGTNGESQGVIPFLKVANDTAVAVNQGGKRKGAMCAYLETWHLDVEDFLELRKNVGDERRRTHDMNTANWIPDLFMKRVKQNSHWTLFSPSDVPDLHDLYGSAFEERYKEYEQMAELGKITHFKQVEAMTLWRKMLSMIFETGHPWITFKDPSNVRSPQDHVGVIHSSNLCTEILLNTSEHETAVCNLGSINLPLHINEKALDLSLLEKTITTAMRMLDNVIDINYYPTIEAKNANLRHRPVGLGLMGFQDALYKMKMSYASDAAVEFADRSMEAISYYAILASTKLAQERGSYETFTGSKWDRGLLPLDTIDLLEQERGLPVAMDRSSTLDWSVVRTAIAKSGMRNSNCMAIAPTATISNITGVSQSIEPTFKNLFAKGNLSGDFTVINNYLVEDLKTLGIWDKVMIEELKYMDGSIHEIDRIPASLREIYRTAFEIEPRWYIECASRRQKWIDMGQSLNLYIAAPSGRKLSEMYLHAWESGLKTTYYARSVAANTIEKTTLQSRPRWATEGKSESVLQEAKACSLEARMRGEECEACQ
ncbi:MAG: ribonucleoside-diphosphate reductase subunit alpha [Chthoniobacterales bacterium]|nr:ribonucleoside-diphosphate reductase subunit alpha [Chthoniobacterales bacterium]